MLLDMLRNDRLIKHTLHSWERRLRIASRPAKYFMYLLRYQCTNISLTSVDTPMSNCCIKC